MAIWNDPDEKIFDNLAVAVGSNALSFDVPSCALAGVSLARFRLSTAGDLDIVGPASDGEVEDYAVTIVPPPPVLDLNGPAGGRGYSATWNNNGPVSITDSLAATVFELDGSNVSSMTATIVNPLAGDALSATPIGAISVSYNSASRVLTMSGSDSAANYQAVLRTVKYNTSGGPSVATVTVNFVGVDAEGISPTVAATIVVEVPPLGAGVVGRHLFYNQSGTAARYDGNNLAINSSDDNAIATDKTAYLWEDSGRPRLPTSPATPRGSTASWSISLVAPEYHGRRFHLPRRQQQLARQLDHR